MMVVAAAAVVLLVVGACASPAPTAPASAAAGEPTLPASTAPSPGPTDLVVSYPEAMVHFDGWTAACSAVQTDDCEGVAKLFANNLARGWKGVFDASGGRIVVEARASCPGSLPDWADNSSCWQATAPATTGDVCMVIARHPKAEGAVSTFGQVGGDSMTGLAVRAPSGRPVCD